MKKYIYISILFVTTFIQYGYAQSVIPLENAKMIREIAPTEFKNYEGSLLVMPAFKGRGTTKWLTKQFDKNYGKPFYVADATDLRTGYGDDKYPIAEYKYMIFIQSSKNYAGNTEYSFQLVDRSTNTVYYDEYSGNSLRRYLRLIQK